MDNLNQITNEDIDMLNENDDNDNEQNNANDSHDEDNYLFETDTKTPGEILDDFCTELKDINTTLPDSVINHYMRKSGFVVNDEKLVKIISIASQKFISEIVNDVMQHHKLKTKSSNLLNANQAANSAGAGPSTSTAASGGASVTGGNAGASGSNTTTATNKSKTGSTAPLTLTLEDLSQVLTEYGINVKKPYYFM
jgi:transcription initiation factor TFIID subunit 10